jgi:hypothetical protein
MVWNILLVILRRKTATSAALCLAKRITFTAKTIAGANIPFGLTMQNDLLYFL